MRTLIIHRRTNTVLREVGLRDGYLPLSRDDQFVDITGKVYLVERTKLVEVEERNGLQKYIGRELHVMVD